jgi:hypothetical protein
LEISIIQEEANLDLTIFKLRGELVGDEPLLNYARSAYESGTRFLLLDLSRVNVIDSCGLETIYKVYQLYDGEPSKEDALVIRKGILDGTYASEHLKLLKPSKEVKKVLSSGGYDMFLQIFTRKSAAISSFE